MPTIEQNTQVPVVNRKVQITYVHSASQQIGSLHAHYALGLGQIFRNNFLNNRQLLAEVE